MGQVFPQRFCLVCPSYPVSPSRLWEGSKREAQHYPVLPPDHSLRSGHQANTLGTSRPLIIKDQRIPANLETAHFCWNHRLGYKPPPHNDWDQPGQRAAQSRQPGSFLELHSAPRRTGITKKSCMQSTVGAPQEQIKNSAPSGGLIIIWDCGTLVAG